ncbi:MAG TPA: hypothetical protein VGA56_20290 [Opitutaceae bacterium]
MLAILRAAFTRAQEHEKHDRRQCNQPGNADARGHMGMRTRVQFDGF